ncbi:MAG: YdcF family protein [Proteobacteria bacterium]|nr:YdcF family protein [Pseudomonadota bacterium]
MFRKTPARPLASRIAAGGLGTIFVIAILWLGGLLWFTGNLERGVANATEETDAIVVLTGGSGRIETGFTLLAEGRTKMLFVSGVGPATSREQIRRLVQQSPDRFECCVVLGRDARDTVGNARETAQWMHQQSFASLRLVTGSYHMPRSLIEFRRAMPSAKLIAHPVFPEHVKLDRWWEWQGTAVLIAEEYTKYLFSVVRLRLMGASNRVGRS